MALPASRSPCLRGPVRSAGAVPQLRPASQLPARAGAGTTTQAFHASRQALRCADGRLPRHRRAKRCERIMCAARRLQPCASHLACGILWQMSMVIWTPTPPAYARRDVQGSLQQPIPHPAERAMTTANPEQEHGTGPNEHAGPTDRGLSTAVLTMLLILAVLMGLLVPVGMVLLH